MSDREEAIILCVDDDAATLFALGRVLKRSGFGVLAAGTGEEALRLVKRGADLVLLDVQLPDLSGFEVCRRIKADPATSSIPVLHLSPAATSGQDQATSLEEGADGYLTQPVDPQVLVAAVRAMLRVRRAEREARETAASWQATFDAVGAGVALLDREGRVRRCNAALGGILGTLPESLVGKPHPELLYRGELAGEECAVEQLARTGSRATGEVERGGGG